jgi:hypothetical protein
MFFLIYVALKMCVLKCVKILSKMVKIKGVYVIL